jgi:hypothetical protein
MNTLYIFETFFNRINNNKIETINTIIENSIKRGQETKTYERFDFVADAVIHSPPQGDLVDQFDGHGFVCLQVGCHPDSAGHPYTDGLPDEVPAQMNTRDRIKTIRWHLD